MCTAHSEYEDSPWRGNLSSRFKERLDICLLSRCLLQTGVECRGARSKGLQLAAGSTEQSLLQLSESSDGSELSLLISPSLVAPLRALKLSQLVRVLPTHGRWISDSSELDTSLNPPKYITDSDDSESDSSSIIRTVWQNKCNSRTALNAARQIWCNHRHIYALQLLSLSLKRARVKKCVKMPRANPWYFDVGPDKRVYFFRDGKRLEDRKKCIDYVSKVQPHMNHQGTHYIHVSA